MSSDAISLEIEHPDGRFTRWGPDELSGEDVPTGLTITTQVPGGDISLSCNLLRRIDADYPDQGLVDRVTALGDGGDVLFHGTQAEFPREHDSGFGITPGAVGRGELLKRDRNFRPIYVDRDPASWKPPSLARRVAHGANPWEVDYRAEVAGGYLGFEGPTDKQVLDNSLAELHYICPAGTEITEFRYRGTEDNVDANHEGAFLFTDSDDLMAGAAAAVLTLDDTLRSQSVAVPQRYAMLRVAADATHTPTAALSRRFSKVAVYGDHGLTVRASSDPTNEPGGLWLSDIVDHIVATCAPGLPRDIEQDTYVVEHFALHDPVSAEGALTQLNKFAFAEFGVYNGRFFWRQPNPDRLTWECRLDGGAGVVLEGDQAEDLYSGCIVYFTDYDRQTRSVGPPGFGCDYESDFLQVTDPTNPYVKWDEPKLGKLEISQVTSQVGATQIGMAWLAEASVPKRRGTLVLRGTALHPTMGKRPVSRVRAGDWIRIGDHPASLARRIVRTTYRHDTRTLDADLDNTPFLVEPLLEAMGVNLVGVL